MVLEDNDGGLDGKKAIIYAKRCDVYMNKKNYYEGWVLCGSVRF